jgi:hypothetical protein
MVRSTGRVPLALLVIGVIAVALIALVLAPSVGAMDSCGGG